MSGDGRTAIVVCAGVGDNQNGQAADRTASGLVGCGRFVSATERREWFPSPGEEPQELHRYTLTVNDGGTVDLYEFWWADLSRFPAAMRSYIVAAYGLILQLPAVGIPALRGGRPLGEEPVPGHWAPPSARPLAWIEWLLSVPLLVVSGVEVALIGAFALFAWTNGQSDPVPPAASWGALILYAAAVTVVGGRWLWRYTRDDGRYAAFWVGSIFFVTAAVVTGVRSIEDNSILAGLADCLLLIVMYIVRGIWILIGGAMAALVVCLAASRRRMSQTREAGITALGSAAGATAGFAILTGALLAAAGAAVHGLTSTSSWADAGTTHVPWCLSRAFRWTPISGSKCPTSAQMDPWHWGLDLYTRLLSPLVYVAIIAIAVAVFGLIIARGYVRGVLLRRSSSTGNGVTALIDRLDNEATEWALGLGVLVAAVMIMLIWLPIWTSVPRADGTNSGNTPPAAAVAGWAIIGLVALARILGFSFNALRQNSAGNERARLVLDKVYDVATFLREPGRSTKGIGARTSFPRQRILRRYRALLKHLLRNPPVGRGYTHMVFFAHSQGSVLTATLLAQSLPRHVKVDLITFGCPLDQLYARRLPEQFAWAAHLGEEPDRYVKKVTGTWINFVGSSDLVGGTIFHDLPHGAWMGPWSDYGDPTKTPKLQEIQIEGGHGSYWTNSKVFAALASLAV